MPRLELRPNLGGRDAWAAALVDDDGAPLAYLPVTTDDGGLTVDLTGYEVAPLDRQPEPDALDLSGAAEAAAALLRRRVVTTCEHLAGAEIPPGELRDMSIALAAMGEAVKAMDDVAGREAIHRTVLKRWRDDVRALVSALIGRDPEGGSMRYNLPSTVAVVRPGGAPEREIGDRLLWPVIEGVLAELDDRLWEPRRDDA